MAKKFGLVLEGGGMRGAYTSGVLRAFMDEGIKFPYIIGVSAGANNAANFIAEQKDRNKIVFVDYVSHKEYSGLKYFIKGKGYFNMDFLFNTLPNRLVPFDYETFFNSKTVFKICVTDVETGEPVYFDKSQLDGDKKMINKVLRASSSLPIFSPPVEINGKLYYDGGVTDSIPIEKSIEDGNICNVIVLTRNRGYVKKKQRLGPYSKHYLKKYPNILKALSARHIKYNKALEKINILEKEGYAFVFRPIAPLKVNRLEKDITKLEELYNQGYKEAMERIDQLKRWIEEVSKE
ncbi:patatin-like phospholipase family protein [Tepidimicrobium xylanilyticum]|uniref:Predicted phospholipase, patatin/cPLA2 family n=1 Tax=Tepidimicrobium xylanilyticum TaxID=1123352 RepID=A0A1H3E150_9FIRM|nr:patatin family protein [Tepidimicrobium xylanilyticum]SDX72018.1 Predicted phospholipase, patatin/cPLA2 family [Tepidimicrobium xylanilyticum]